MNNEPPIRRSPVPSDTCNLSRSLALIGDRRTLLVLRSALYGLRRFDDFQADTGIPRTVLSDRLAKLVACGLMERRQYREEGKRPRPEYPLTEMGRALALPLFAITEWGDRWLGKGPPPMTLHSRTSGDRLTVSLVDEKGHAVPMTQAERQITSR